MEEEKPQENSDGITSFIMIEAMVMGHLVKRDLTSDLRQDQYDTLAELDSKLAKLNSADRGILRNTYKLVSSDLGPIINDRNDLKSKTDVITALKDKIEYIKQFKDETEASELIQLILEFIKELES
jgi:bacterioferritin (cytochrome b1)